MMGRGSKQPAQGIAGARRLSRQLTRATLIILFGVGAVVIGGLYWATLHSDRISIQRQERIARHAFEIALDELALQQETVAVWDELAARMFQRPRDEQWLFDNVGSWLHKIYGHDEAWLLDERDRPMMMVVAGRRVPISGYAERSADVLTLIRAIRGTHHIANGIHDRHPGQPLAAKNSVRTTPRAVHDTHLVHVDGRPAAASAMLIKPSTPGFVGPRESWPVLVSVRYLDVAFTRELEARHLIEDARFSRSGRRRENERALLIRTEQGDELGYLIWTPELPGSRIVATLLPANLVALALLALVTALLLRRLTHSLRDRGALEERATYLAYHDALTGLPNRSLLNERLAKDLAGGTRGGELALLLIDLDRFKQVNDTLGHLAGDELIRQFAERLVAELGTAETVVRLGGDEFAVVLRGAAAKRAMERCDTILALFERPFDLNGTSIYAGASIGAARSPERPVSGTELMRRADVALYRAKADGRNRARLFAPKMDEASRQRAQIESELRHAVETQQFTLWRQPQVDRQGELVGHELLLRWEHPELGTVSPDRIVPVAEETGLILPIGDWVIGKALEVAAEAPQGLFTAINLSPAQLRDDGFVGRIIQACRTAGVDPTQIELEITEQTLLDDSRIIRNSLRRLRRAGFRIALDDFGTGYSSLSYLRRFAVDKIKIDRSFVADLERSAEAPAIIAAIVTLGRALGLSVAAEGVETARQEQMLLAAGCDQLQGHYYAPARPFEERPRSAA